MTAEPQLVATCWTSAGDAAPLRPSEASPFTALDRVRAAAAGGWSGIGFNQDDLRHARDTIGLNRLRDEIDRAGLTHTEVELGTGWWSAADDGRETWELLLKAASALQASFIKVGTAAFPNATEPRDDTAEVAPLVEPLRRIADEADAVGTRVALEPLPFGTIASLPQGAALIRAAAHPAAGLIVDFWHVFRAGTSLQQVEDALEPGLIFGVELCDADAPAQGSLFADTRDNRKLLGHGTQNVTGFIDTMRRLDWTGPWGVEILSTEHRALPLDEALRVARTTTLDVFRSMARKE